MRLRRPAIEPDGLVHLRERLLEGRSGQQTTPIEGMREDYNPPKGVLRDRNTSNALVLMTYVVVFDIADAGYKSLSFPAAGLIFVGIGALFVALRGHIPRWS